MIAPTDGKTDFLACYLHSKNVIQILLKQFMSQLSNKRCGDYFATYNSFQPQIMLNMNNEIRFILHFYLLTFTSIFYIYRQ